MAKKERYVMKTMFTLSLQSFFIFSCCSAAQTHGPDRIPIGLLLDDTNSDILSAFHYQVSQINSRQLRFKLAEEMIKLPMDNSFLVGSAICQLMTRGIFAFFATHTSSTLNTLKSYSTKFRMPFITSRMAINTSYQEGGYELYMQPFYAKALLDLIRHYDWKEVWYIYSQNEGLERLQQLFDIMTDEEYVMRVHVYRVLDGNDAFKTLQHIDSRKADDKRVLLDLPTKESENLLRRENHSPKGIKHHYMFVGLGLGEITVSTFSNGGINITGLRLVDMASESSQFRRIFQELSKSENFKMDIDPQTFGESSKLTYESALAVDAVHVFGAAITKLVSLNANMFKSTFRDRHAYNGSDGLDCDSEPLQHWKHGFDIMKAMREIEIVGLTGSIKFDKFGLRRDYKLEVLEVSLSRGLATIGIWKPEAKPRLSIKQPTLVRLKGNNTIANRTRIITSIMTNPFLMLAPLSPKGESYDGNLKYEGYCADLARLLADIIKFDYIIQPVKDLKYGNNDNGNWSGMVGELLRGEADMAIAPLTITSKREQVIDFSKPFMSLGISIMIKKPDKESPGVFSFMNPLSYEVWMCVIFAYIGVSVVLFLVSRFSPFEWHIEDSSDGVAVANNFTIFNSLWFSLGAFMQQGVDIEPRSLSGRIVGSVWWFFTLILISSYTANLAAFLTAERMQSPIESADDLAKQTEIKYGIVDSGSTKEFFSTSSIPVYERMWAFMQSAEPTVFVVSTRDGVNQVRAKNGKYAFLTESTTNDYENQRKPCDTMKVGGNLDAKGYGVATPMGSDLRDRITLAVLELIEKGDLANLEKTWWYDKGQCLQDGVPKKQEATSSLKLPNVAGIFYILICGLGLSLIMASIEFLYKSRLEARRRKTSFSRAARSGARLSITGTQRGDSDDAPDTQPDIPPNMSVSTYSYAPAAQLVGIDGYGDSNLQTQV